MHNIIIASYLTAAAAFFVATALLALGWRGQRTGAMLILATAISAAWGLLLTYAEWRRTLAFNWLLLAEVLRYGTWLMFVSALFGNWRMSGFLRGFRGCTQALWILLALYCLLPVSGWPGFDIVVPLVGILLLAFAGIVLLEQILRNARPEQRWALKFLLIALGVMFVYDIFLYSYAVLYHDFKASFWATRGFVDALLAPLLLVAAARNRKWSLDVGVSRNAVFYSTGMVLMALYIIATAAGGYVVRLYGGDWGRVAEIALFCFALLAMLLLAVSGQARSRLRMFVNKNFFSYHHDYREQWLQLTATLAASDSETELSQRAVRALAQIMDSPAGALFMRNEIGDYMPEADWNMPLPAHLKLAADTPALVVMREKRWIHDLSAPAHPDENDLRVPVELTGLPRAWLLVPLVLEDQLIGFVVLAQARARRALDWEDIDLLRTAGSQVAGTLVQAINARRLSEARQFEGFNRLTAFLMHDLKNVAAQQSLLLQNAVQHKRNPEFVDDMLTTVAHSSSRIKRLLEQLRAGEIAAVRNRVRIATVLDKAMRECRTQLPAPVVHRAEEDLWIRADVEQLATALEHLVRNAKDAATPHGQVELHVHRAPGQAVIDIIDDGAGMDETFIRDSLFKPFFTTKASKGMGIGAYQARACMHSLGGTLHVRSTPGQGTVFTVRLPLAMPEDAAVSVDDTMKAPS